MQLLGVFTRIYGENAEMTLSRTLLISLVGFMIVFLILGILAIFVKSMGKVFDGINEKKKPAPMPKAPAAAFAGIPLPENQSEGSIELVNVSEEDAAVIMAIVSHRSGVPLNRLKFNSIKLSEEEK